MATGIAINKEAFVDTRKKIIIIGGGVLLVIIVILAIFSFQRVGKVGIEIVLAPKQATLTIDGQPASAGTVYLTKGQHTLKASLEHFDDTSVTIDTNTIDPQKAIYLSPYPNSVEAFAWLQNHPEAQSERERLSGENEAQQLQEALNIHPIMKKLPYETIDYKIGYRVTDENKILFNVVLYPYAKPGDKVNYDKQIATFKEDALNFLRDNGIDTTSAEITFEPAN